MQKFNKKMEKSNIFPEVSLNVTVLVLRRGATATMTILFVTCLN
jgi:hypothetical protein